MLYFEAPKPLDKDVLLPLVFLAGGITDCEDWQSTVTHSLLDRELPGTLLNPRQKNFRMGDPSVAEEHIRWERKALWRSQIIAFWFAGGESVQPIVMFAFGQHLARYCIDVNPIQMVIGIDPNYRRIEDVEVQTTIANEQLPPRKRIFPSYSLAQHIQNIGDAIL